MEEYIKIDEVIKMHKIATTNKDLYLNRLEDIKFSNKVVVAMIDYWEVRQIIYKELLNTQNYFFEYDKWVRK